MERLDDKELICFSCHDLFPYFDLTSRMAVWKEQPGGTGVGSADQSEHWAWTDRRRLMDSDALSSKVMGSEVLGWLGSNALRSEVLVGEAGTGQGTAG